jgi:hypothetical protein
MYSIAKDCQRMECIIDLFIFCFVNPISISASQCFFSPLSFFFLSCFLFMCASWELLKCNFFFIFLCCQFNWHIMIFSHQHVNIIWFIKVIKVKTYIFFFSKVRTMLWPWEGVGVLSPTLYKFLLVLGLTRLFIVISVRFVVSVGYLSFWESLV